MVDIQSNTHVYKVSTCCYRLFQNNKESLVIQSYLKESNSLMITHINNFNNKLKLV